MSPSVVVSVKRWISKSYSYWWKWLKNAKVNFWMGLFLEVQLLSCLLDLSFDEASRVWRNPPALPPLTIMNSTVTTMESFRFLGTTISQDLKWDTHIVSIVKKVQQRLYFLRQLRKFNLPQELLKQFYSAIIESVLCTSITVWFSSATKSDLRRPWRVVRTAERIIGTTLPTLQELYSSRVSKRAGKITLDPSHPAHSLFELLPSGRRYRALCTRMTRHRNSFFPQAVHLMNTWQ